MQKSRFFIWSYLCIALLTAVLLGASLAASPTEPNDHSRIETTSYFLVQAQDDTVIVCRNTDMQPIMTLGVSLHSLPLYDQEQIRNGLRLNTLEELEQFIEDFES